MQSTNTKNNDHMHNTWTKAISNLEKVVPAQNFINWIQPIQYSGSYGDTIVLTAPNQFFKEWLEDNYLELIQSIISATADKNIAVEFLLREEEPLQTVLSAPEKNNADDSEEVRYVPATIKITVL